MPTVLKIKGYRFFFFSNERDEPIHIHIEHENKYAKFWLEPIALAKNVGFRAFELTEIRNIIVENKKIIVEEWNEYFAS